MGVMRVACRPGRTGCEAALLVWVLAACATGLLACSRSAPKEPNAESIEPGETLAQNAALRSLAFFDESRRVASLTVDDLRRRVEPVRVEVIEPYEHAKVAFIAFPLEAVLDEAYGPSWRTREAILFTCRDGYAPTIPVRRVLDHRAFLAIARLGDVGFTVLKDEEGTKKRIELGPFYVIWENVDNARVRNEGDYGWPYQVVQIDLVTFRSRFHEMAPPSDAGLEVLAGFDAFIAHCSKCHAINGRGGSVGPELNYPANPTEYMNGEWLRKWIDDPTSMRLRPRMPPLNPDLPDRTRIIDEIVAYLGAMASHKLEPSEP